ncbi:MAG TPA: cell division protein ZapA [Geobacteraceae bacterium]
MKTSHRIRVLGRELLVKSSASTEMVAEVEDYVNRTLADVAAMVNSGDTQLVTILALMTIAEQLLTCQRQAVTGETVDRERLVELASKIDHALG